MTKETGSKRRRKLQSLDENQKRSDLRKNCPVCGEPMQRSGQKADSNGVVKQRYLCTSCKRAGSSPYNFFELDVK